jgi:hypothetical protein
MPRDSETRGLTTSKACSVGAFCTHITCCCSCSIIDIEVAGVVLLHHVMYPGKVPCCNCDICHMPAALLCHTCQLQHVHHTLSVAPFAQKPAVGQRRSADRTRSTAFYSFSTHTIHSQYHIQWTDTSERHASSANTFVLNIRRPPSASIHINVDMISHMWT